MRQNIIHLTIVEMRRALHRRLVRAMVLLAVALADARRRHRLRHQPRPSGIGPRADAPCPHGVVVGRRR